MTRCVRIRLAFMPFALLLGACATTPPPMTELAAADAAIAAAVEAGARDFAPVEFGFASDKRRAAATALADKDYALSQRLALQAEADAALAEAKSRAAAGRNAVQQKSAENERLRRDLLDGGVN